MMTRGDMAEAIAARLERDAGALRAAFESATPVRHFVVDELVDPEVVTRLRGDFPASEKPSPGGPSSRSAAWCWTSSTASC